MKSIDQRIRTIFKSIDRPASPGVSLRVEKRGELVHEQCMGLASLEMEAPITPETVFNIGSVSKQFTAFMVALLEQDGRLSLQDDIHRYLPEMQDFGVPVTLHHLIHHISGIPNSYVDLLVLAGWKDGDVTTQQDALSLIFAQEHLNFAPGEEFQYSNSNYVLLAEICRRVGGKDFACLLRERVLDPLEMNNTAVNDSVFKIIPKKASGYYKDPQGHWSMAPLHDSVLGSTNIYTNPADLAKWLHNLVTGHVGGEELAQKMRQPATLNNGASCAYGFGLDVGPEVEHHGWQVAEHSGTHGGYVSHAMFYLQLDLSVCLMFNHFRFDMPARARDVADLFLPPGKTLPASTAVPHGQIPLDEHDLKQWTGVYYNEKRGALRRVGWEKGRLTYEGLPTDPTGPGTFRFTHRPDYKLVFNRDPDGEKHACLHTPSGPYTYDQVQPVDARTLDLSEYAGEYVSRELGVHWHLLAQKKGLTVKRRRYVDTHPQPVLKDIFSDDWKKVVDFPLKYLLIFNRDTAGRVRGFRVSGIGVRYVGFEKIPINQ